MDKHLTGADVFWLAVWESGGVSGAPPDGITSAWLHSRAVLGAHSLHLEGSVLFEAHLEGACLDEAHLENAILTGAQLEEASLANTHLEGADFFDAHLEGANLSEAHLEGARLVRANLGGKRMPTGDVLSPADLTMAFFDRETNLNSVNLGTMEYGYASLLDVGWGDANLAVVDWTRTRHRYLGLRTSIEAIELGEERTAHDMNDSEGNPKDKELALIDYERAVRATRQLATALHNQGLNEDADRFAYRAQLLQREVLRRQGIQKIPEYLWSLFLWGTAGYGYRIWRILAVYVGILVTFTVIYVALGVHSHTGEPGIQALWDSFLVSLSAIHGRTFFEQVGAWSPAAWVAAIESVFGIVIEGIFVAMLIQRFFSR